MTRKRFFDERELAARGWHPRCVRLLLGQPARSVPARGDLYAIAVVVAAEAEPEWAGQMRLAFEEEAARERVAAARRERWDRLNSKQTALYRLFDEDGVLLYVGITADLKKRFYNHRCGNGKTPPKAWWPQVAEQRIEWFDDRSEAEDAESFAIVAEHPLHNQDKTSGWFVSWFLGRWLEERIGAGPTRGRRRLHDRLSGHWVPRERWWSPCRRRRAQLAEAAGEEGFDGRWREVLDAGEVVAQTRARRGECVRCRVAYPCAEVRAVAEVFSGHPQYAALWEQTP
ncbi:GIY-YIG nuclease family protein [Kitasatospora sp. NPDC051914]|uniref:GIY-YIG nuclease family protein n=1 Tax=Kitasatospora sp. NPDC051914 TaxID=3154945 RepID=UPI003414303F